MIDHLFQITLSNIIISLMLAILAAITGKMLKRPMITHLLWFLVFLKLLTPPVFTIQAIPMPGMSESTLPVNLTINEQQDIQTSEVKENTYFSSEKGFMKTIQGKHWLLIIWGMGGIAVFIWSILQVYRFHRLLKKESETASPEIQSKAVKISICMGLNAVPIIRITSANIIPMVWWIGGKVWIVIPDSLIKQMDPEQFEYILSHELAHVHRRDYLIRWIEWIVCVCFWWNPVTWWARSNLRASEELCCDALVLSSMKPKPHSYGNSLLKAIEILSFPNRHPSIIASGINDGKSIKRRVKMIISNDLIKSKLRWLQACIIFGGLIILPLGLMNAKEHDNNKQAGMFDENIQSEGSWLENMNAAVEEIHKTIETSTMSMEKGKTADEKLYELQWIDYRIKKHLAYIEAQVKKTEALTGSEERIKKEVVSLKDKLTSLQARVKAEILKTKNTDISKEDINETVSSYAKEEQSNIPGREINRPTRQDWPQRKPGDKFDEFRIIILITKEGEIRIENKKVDIASMVSRMERFHKEYPDGIVLIAGYNDTRLGRTIEVLDKVRMIGITNVSVATVNE